MIGQTVSHYRILEKLGAGGMGVVYKAEDLSLQRFVALKFLPPESAASDSDRSRLVHEARASALLLHPHICPVYEIGESEGRTFIAMAYLEGRSLRDRLSEGPLPVDEALKMAKEVGEALSAAHEKGIVHRDVKPGNVMVTPEGRAVLMDFGLARMTGATKLTRTGTTMGTAAYMSPEQIQGRDVDARTDLWALGVMLYEMVSGELPFQAEYEPALAYAIANQEPKALSGSEIPAGLAGVIAKSLAKNASDRYATAGAFVADIDELLGDRQAMPAGRARQSSALVRTWKRWRPWERATALGATAMFVAALVWGSVAFWPDRGEAIDAIAVLPLVNLSGDAAKEAYADGLTGELTACLGSIGSVRIISTQTMRQFKGSSEPMPEIGRRIGAKGLVEGSISLTGTAVQITVKLFDAARDRMLWSNTYQGEIENVLFILNDIASTIANEIGAKPTSLQRQRLQNARKVNPDAWKAYMEGVSYAFGIDEEGDRTRSLKMIECFNRAIGIDSEFAPAYAALALAYVNLATVGANPGEAGLEARRAGQRAMELDASLAEAHAALGAVKLNVDWDWPGAESELRRAIELNPSSSDALSWWRFYLLVVGRGKEAVSVAQHLCELQASSPGVLQELGWTCLCARRYDEAITAFGQVLSKNPKNTYTRRWLADTYALKGMREKFFAECDSLKALGSDGSYYSYAICGVREKALARVEELRDAAEREYVEPVYLATYYAVLGDKDKAFSWLRRGFETRSVGMVRIMKADPYFDGLHSDPRWSELLRLMKFPEGNL